MRKFGFCSKGKHAASLNGKDTYVYKLWDNMINRCYNESTLKERPTYRGCSVSDNFLDFQFFAEWCQVQVGFGKTKFQLDKDLLSAGSKIYSEDVCVFVPIVINSMIGGEPRSKYGTPKGVYWHKGRGVYIVQLCDVDGVVRQFGQYNNVESAVEVYTREKLATVRVIANKWKEQLDDRVYKVLMDGTWAL